MKQLVITLLITIMATLACSLSGSDQNGDNGAASISRSTVEPTETVDPVENREDEAQASTNNPNSTIVNCTVRSSWFSYTVVRGDTLFSIARRANSSVAELAQANCLEDPTTIRTGQRLYLPVQIPAGDEPRSSEELVRIYLIALDDNGASGIPIGCGDSAIAIWRDRELSDDTVTNLRASLEELFAIRTENYGQSGLTHSLADVEVSVDSVSIQNGRATIELSGDFLLVGTCGDARMVAQIFLTVFQYSGFDEAFITMNERNLKQWFDMSGMTGDNDPFLRTDFGYLE